MLSLSAKLPAHREEPLFSSESISRLSLHLSKKLWLLLSCDAFFTLMIMGFRLLSALISSRVIYRAVVSPTYAIVPITLRAFQDAFTFVFISDGFLLFRWLSFLVFLFWTFTNTNHTTNMKKICVSE